MIDNLALHAMSIFYRKEYIREKIFLKNLNLKNCNRELSMVLAPNFDIEKYIDTFQECFPHLWEDIVSFCNTRKDNYLRRKKKRLRTVSYYSPEKYLVKHARPQKLKPFPISEVERDKNKERLIITGKQKQQQRNDKLENNLVYVQEVCPPYVDNLIDAYFDIRKQQTLNVNARYLILLEASQFKCKQTLTFLHKVNACDKNQDLRMMAFYTLQRMGEHPWLGRKRKGKKRLSQVKRIDIQKNPTELLEILSKNQTLLYHNFDIFLSHSSRDEKELLKIKSILNKQGYTVYIDWVNDRKMLNRANQDENTWNALFLRMDQSCRLLYVMTDNCISSESTQKEVEYFKAKSKSVYVYQPKAISMTEPEYLIGCIKLDSIDPILFDKDESKTNYQ